MKPPGSFAVGTVLLGLMLVSSARAAEPSKFVSFLAGKRPGEGKTFACFVTTYDDAHLSTHPQQNVRAVRMLATVYSNHDYSYQLRIGLNFRDRAESLSTVAECGAGRERDTLRKAAVCAGIGGKVLLAIENKNSVQLSLPLATGLWRPGPPQPNNPVNGAFAEDERHFRLTRAPLAQCDDHAIDEAEKAVLDRDR
jgi:hypothetical protein